MVFKNICVIVLWMKVASALGGLRAFHIYHCSNHSHMDNQDIHIIKSISRYLMPNGFVPLLDLLFEASFLRLLSMNVFCVFLQGKRLTPK